MAIATQTTGIGTLASVAWTPLDGTGLSPAQTDIVSDQVEGVLAVLQVDASDGDDTADHGPVPGLVCLDHVLHVLAETRSERLRNELQFLGGDRRHQTHHDPRTTPSHQYQLSSPSRGPGNG